MRGYIVSIDARDADEHHVLKIFGRLENNKSFATDIIFKPYFHIHKIAQEVAQDILKEIPHEFVEDIFSDFDNKEVVKLQFKQRKQYNEAVKLLRDTDMKLFEYDIKSALRFVIDNDIYSVIEIKGREVADDFADIRFEDALISALQMKPQDVVKTFKPNILSIDIETDRKAQKIFSIGMYSTSHNVREVLVIHDKELKDAISVKDEYALLELFFQRIRELDPDVLVGWNFVDFDLSVIRKRALALNIPFILGRGHEESRLRIENSFFRDSKAYLMGRQVVDGIWLLKHSFVVLEDYKLDTAAKTLLGREKLKDEGAAIAPNIEKYLGINPQMVVDYNLLDAKLVLEVFDKVGVIDLALARSVTSGLFLSEINLSIKSLDSLYIRELVKLQKVSPTNSMSLREYGVMGGYVLDPDAGLYENVIVLDFKSLYPSVMITFNIDPFSYIEGKDYALTQEQAKEQNIVLSPNGARFKGEEGILPAIIEKIWKQRDIAKKNKDDVSSYAFKILMNSLWGAIASSSSRFFSLEIANSITGFCQKMIKLAAKKIEEDYGLKVIYGDTDSVFIQTNEKEVEKVRALGVKITKEINEFFTKYISDIYGRKSKLELEFEKTYLKYLIPHARGSDEGSKKRYAGLVIKDDDSTYLDFVGLEYVRSDATPLVKDFQYHLMEKMFNDEDVENYIKTFVADLRAGKFDEQLVYKKSLRKPLEEYTKTTPPHVKAARKIPDGPKARAIRYFITVDGPEPEGYVKSSIDYEHYVEKQIKPVAKSALSVIGVDVEEILMDKKQSSLFDF